MRAVSFDRYRQGGDGGGGPERYCRKLEKLSSTPARPVLSLSPSRLERISEMSGSSRLTLSLAVSLLNKLKSDIKGKTLHLSNGF